MSVFREGKVVSLGGARGDLLRARVALDDSEIDACAWRSMIGSLEVGDRVVVNTTGIDLGLGTGGAGFILWNLDGPAPDGSPEGHIVKLRYTPWQMGVLAAEAPESPHHLALRGKDSLDGMPVVACSLHSQIAGVAAGIKAANPGAKVGYLMTDAAALPLEWSDLVAELKQVGLIDVTATCGHAFGGDLETVNVFSGMLALRWAAECDVIVVAMGPGVVGTGTALGFTGMEQGQILDASSALGGRALACLRINFSDERERHRGVSHHSLSALAIAARDQATVVVPKLPPDQARSVADQLRESGVCDRHVTKIVNGKPGLELLLDRGISPESMGRSIDEIPELFLAAAAAGIASA